MRQQTSACLLTMTKLEPTALASLGWVAGYPATSRMMAGSKMKQSLPR